MMNAIEQFVEKATEYPLEHGTLWIYETNVACRDIKFKFGSFVLTIMLLGHKNIRSPQINFEFFPGTLFIPEKETEMAVTIPNASFANPTQCLVLEIDPAFMADFVHRLSKVNPPWWAESPSASELTHFYANDARIIDSFTRLFQLRKGGQNAYDDMIVTHAMQELLLRVYQTEGGKLLLANTQVTAKAKGLKKVTQFITSHLNRSISVDELAKIAGASRTSLFQRFKTELGLTPVQYITQERIAYAKLLLGRNGYLKETAFQCGFNSYEHFCKSFKRLEGVSPRQYREQLQAMA